MFNQCFDNTQPTVIIRNRQKYRYRSSSKSSYQTTYLLDIEQKSDVEELKARDHVHLENTKIIGSSPSTKFIIDDISEELFRQALYKLKNSIWWNIRGFFIIKSIQTINSCESASFFLKTIWEFNILNAIFLCRAANYEILVYTFNPYSGTASKFWRTVGSYPQENGHTLTLFRNMNSTMGKYV